MAEAILGECKELLKYKDVVLDLKNNSYNSLSCS